MDKQTNKQENKRQPLSPSLGTHPHIPNSEFEAWHTPHVYDFQYTITTTTPIYSLIAESTRSTTTKRALRD